MGPSPLTPYLRVNGGGWQKITEITVAPGAVVDLSPQPVNGGSWSWTGPGRFRSTAREIDRIPLSLATNQFTAVYTNPEGATDSVTFTIEVAPSEITPYVQVGGGDWQNISGVTVNLGDVVNLRTEPSRGRSWLWSGPGGFTSSSREIDDIPLKSATNFFTVAYLNPEGVESTYTFTITVAPVPIVPSIQVNGGRWQDVASATVHYGDTVNLRAHAEFGGSWSWTGPNGFTSTSREIDDVPLTSSANVYTAAYSPYNFYPGNALSTQVFTISVIPAANGCTSPNPNPNPNPESFAEPGDFNSDCRSDILWRNRTSEEADIWLMNGTSVLSQVSPGARSSDWVIQGVGDFSGEHAADVLWRNSTSGEVGIWFMKGTEIESQESVASVSSDWAIAGVGDFDGDGDADILWRNSTTGEVYLWLMNWSTTVGQGSVGIVSPDWVIRGVGDFNGDGKADILWQNSTTGEVYIWLMNGRTIIGQGGVEVISPSSGWSVAGVGDFDGNGTSDILWRNSATGDVYIWLMSGTTITGQGDLGDITSDWVIQGAGDYNGDGKADVLWRNSTSGDAYIWLMNGISIANQGGLGDITSDWVISPLVSP